MNERQADEAKITSIVCNFVEETVFLFDDKECVNKNIIICPRLLGLLLDSQNTHTHARTHTHALYTYHIRDTRPAHFIILATS